MGSFFLAIRKYFRIGKFAYGYFAHRVYVYWTCVRAYTYRVLGSIGVYRLWGALQPNAIKAQVLQISNLLYYKFIAIRRVFYYYGIAIQWVCILAFVVALISLYIIYFLWYLKFVFINFSFKRLYLLTLLYFDLCFHTLEICDVYLSSSFNFSKLATVFEVVAIQFETWFCFEVRGRLEYEVFYAVGIKANKLGMLLIYSGFDLMRIFGFFWVSVLLVAVYVCNALWFAVYSCVGYTVIFCSNLIVYLLLTLIIATITLIERKVLALVQRRVGPNYIGYKGRFQFIADALKLLLKHIIVLPRVNRLLFMLLPASILVICYLFWVNLIWGPNLAICEVEYNLLFMAILSLMFSYCLFLVGWITKNKYAILSSNRVLVMFLNLEIFLNFFLLVLLCAFESFSFYQIVSFQSGVTWGIFVLLPLLPILIITFLLETGRIPFDLGEAESELIAGYTVEMGGFFFALFYLGEYFHLFCFSFTYTLCLLGGWLA